MALNLTPGSLQHPLHMENVLLVRRVAWLTPGDDSWRLNFAGYSASVPNGDAGIGCILRDQNAIFKAGYAAPIRDSGNVTKTELISLKIGLEIALRLGIDYLEIAGDYSIVIRLLLGELLPLPPSVQVLLEECYHFLAQFRSTRIRQLHIHANEPANKLAIIGAELEEPLHWVDKAPPEIAESLLADVIGRWMPLADP